jgi:hypothetical protein
MLLHELAQSDGTYVAVTLIGASNTLLQEWAVENGLAPDDEYHTTILYSRKFVPVQPEVDKLHFARPVGFEIFDGGCLVLKLECQTLVDRNEKLMSMGGTSDYDEYKPHITIAKNVSSMQNLPLPNFSIVLGHEYTEPIDETK